MTTVRAARAADTETVAATLAEAFERDPFSRWVISDPEARVAAMRAMFEHRLKESEHDGATVLVTDDLGAAAIWLPPGMELDGSGPPDARPEVTQAFAAIAASHPVRPHWYLAFLGSAQGQAGRGSALMSHMLAVTDTGAIPTCLWTGAERNLDFYAKHGYGVIQRLDFDGTSAWWLWRDPE